MKKSKEHVTVIDNFLPAEKFLKIQEEVFGGSLPLYYSDNTLASAEFREYEHLNDKFDIDIEGHPYLYHMMYNKLGEVVSRSDIYKPIMEQIDPFALVRIKLNLFLNRGIPVSSGWHVDMGEDRKGGPSYKTGIFHLNTNNGFTLLEDGTTVGSVANRLVVFNGGYTVHTGITQTDADVRAFLNLNYISNY